MLPRISPILWKAFGRYAEWHVGRHFHGVRLLQSGRPPATGDTPLVVYLNHPSWWDPMICLLLARRFWPHRSHYAPMDSAALDRYRFFRKLGFFGVEQGSARGGAAFLRTAVDILQQPRSVLWVTGQGQFTDVRHRPIRLRSGLARLLPHLDRATVIPLAIEYCFWDEPRAEALASFGTPIKIGADDARDAAGWASLLEHHLEQTADGLGVAAISRDPQRFLQLQGGANGINLVYDFWQRLKAAVSGRRYQPGHRTELQR